MADEFPTQGKKALLEQFRGYNEAIDKIRESEFDQLTGIYLDSFGTTLYSKSQVERHFVDLSSTLYGNPHSGSSCSQRSTDLIEEARNIVARHFNTSLDKHHVIFTSGATAALKLVAENFNWKKGSHFVFLQDNHTSVVGIREVAKERGSEIVCISEEELSGCAVQNGTLNARNGTKTAFGKAEIEERKPQITLSVYPEDGAHDVSSSAPSSNSGEIDEETGLCFELAKSVLEEQEKDGCHGPSLFAYPAMSNFCGKKYPLEWAKQSKGDGTFPISDANATWYVLLDAASYVGTSELDLSQIQADFVPISFYKIFGYPTGIGALIMRNDAIKSFRTKCYYGGGTVFSTINKSHHRVFRDEICDRYEDGTCSFLNIIALKHGFYSLKSHAGSMLAITDHTFALTQYTYSEMKSMRHFNGIHLCKIYCDTDYEDKRKQGPAINFNLIGSSGDYIGYSQVEKLASLSNIHLRTGCFCNTGDCQKHLKLSDEQMLANYNAGHVCGDQMDIIDGRPTGSVRISFGYMSTFKDAWGFLNFLGECFLVRNPSVSGGDLSLSSKNPDTQETQIDSKASVDKNERIDSSLKCGVNVKEAALKLCSDLNGNQSSFGSQALDGQPSENKGQANGCLLKRIYVYPVKSCGAFEVLKWTVSEKGLLYDREWMVITEYGSVLTQKKEPRMVFIKPTIDKSKNILILSFEGHGDVAVPLEKDAGEPIQAHDREHCLSRVCGQRVSCDDCGDEAAGWLSRALGKPCRLVRQNHDQKRVLKSKLKENNSSEHHLSLSNECQYLLISEDSLSTLFQGLRGSKDCLSLSDLAASFRGNFLVSGSKSFEEDSWKEVNIGGRCFKTAGKCQRCQMICINQKTAVRNREPLETLVRMRGSQMEFGIYMVAKRGSNGECVIAVGDAVVAPP